MKFTYQRQQKFQMYATLKKKKDIVSTERTEKGFQINMFPFLNQ